jgi:hypothetical protein
MLFVVVVLGITGYEAWKRCAGEHGGDNSTRLPHAPLLEDGRVLSLQRRRDTRLGLIIVYVVHVCVGGSEVRRYVPQWRSTSSMHLALTRKVR